MIMTVLIIDRLERILDQFDEQFTPWKFIGLHDLTISLYKMEGGVIFGVIGLSHIDVSVDPAADVRLATLLPIVSTLAMLLAIDPKAIIDIPISLEVPP